MRLTSCRLSVGMIMESAITWVRSRVRSRCRRVGPQGSIIKVRRRLKLQRESQVLTVFPGWLDLQHHYITTYKTGNVPTVQKDRVFMWGRLYPAYAESPDPLSRPLNFNFVSWQRSCISGVPLFIYPPRPRTMSGRWLCCNRRLT